MSHRPIQNVTEGKEPRQLLSFFVLIERPFGALLLFSEVMCMLAHSLPGTSHLIN